MNTTASELVESLAHQQAGRMGQAETLYQQVLVRAAEAWLNLSGALTGAEHLKAVSATRAAPDIETC